MWTDGEVFRSYGAQKADLKGVDFFSFFFFCFFSHCLYSFPCRLPRVLHPRRGSCIQSANGWEIGLENPGSGPSGLTCICAF